MFSLAVLLLTLSVSSGVNCAGSKEYADDYYPRYRGSGAPPPPPSNQGSDSPPMPASLDPVSRLPPSDAKRRSPVRLCSEVAKPTVFQPLKISVNVSAILTCANDGSLPFCVSANKGSKVATMTGGPTKGTYEFSILGGNHVEDTPFARAATTEDDVSFPAQVRMGFFNSAYTNSSNAMNYDDGLFIIAFNLLVEGVIPNKLAQPYCDVLDRTAKPNSTTSVRAWEVLEWLLVTLEEGYYVYKGSFLDIPSFKAIPCATFISPSFTKHPFVSKKQYISFTNITNDNDQPDFIPLPLFTLAGRDVLQGNSPVTYDCYRG